jgi:hypothetical protein
VFACRYTGLVGLVDKLEDEARALEAKARTKPEPPPRPPGRRDPDGLATCIHLATGARLPGLLVATLLVGGACTTMAIIFVGAARAWTDWMLVGLFGAAAAIAPLYLLAGIVRWPRFAGWRRRLPFPLTGDWETLACDPQDSEYWRKTTVRIVAGDAEAKRAASALLRSFAVRANRSIYKTRWGKIVEWSSNDASASGEANCRVAWKIYRLVSGDLAKVHRAGLRIESVHIEASPTSRSVSAESGD